MKLTIALVLATALATCSPAVASTQSQASSLTGKWTMSITFQQGVTPATLELKQQGEAVTGTLDASFTGGPMPIEGEFSNGELTFSGSTTTGPHPGMQLDFIAKLNGDKLSGMLSWQVGDFSWTAERVQ